jgi:hypothetical protein
METKTEQDEMSKPDRKKKVKKNTVTGYTVVLEITAINCKCILWPIV